MGKKYPKFETAIYADGNTTIVTVSRALSPTHVNLDSPSSAFNGITHLNHLVHIAAAISEIAEDRLSEPETIKNIGLDCKPFIHLRDESEEEADA